MYYKSIYDKFKAFSYSITYTAFTATNTTSKAFSSVEKLDKHIPKMHKDTHIRLIGKAKQPAGVGGNLR